MKRNVRALESSRELGGVVVETSLMIPFLLLLLVIAVDVSRVVNAALTVYNAAIAGALYGSQNLSKSSDISGIVNAANQEAANLASLTIAAQQFCKCGSGADVSCTGLVCNGNPKKTYVRVQTTSAFEPLIGYPGLPQVFNLSRTVVMRVE